MSRPFLILFTVLAATSAPAVAQATVRVEAANLQGSRSLQEQTATAAIRDYLQSWQVMSSALEQNRADLLDPDFVGSAKDTLTETIQQQTALGISTRYQDRAHDLQIVSYSPDGLSIELIDKVDYDMQVLDHDQVKTTQHVSDRYVIVLTPAEVRWRVRVFQGASR
jgi:predicted PhzF superfamily epimerase YddE/YHI9